MSSTSVPRIHCRWRAAMRASIKAGDKLEGHVDGVGDLTITYTQ